MIAQLRIPVLVHLAATVLVVTLTAWLNRRALFRVVALSQMLGSFTTALVVLGAPVFMTPDLIVLFWGYVAGAVASAGAAAIGAMSSHLFGGHPAGLRRVVLLMMKYRVYPAFSLPLSLSALLADRTLLLYLSTAFSLSALGGFFSIRQLLLGLVHLVTATISQVIYSYVARSAQKVASLSAPLLTLASGIAVSAGFCLGWASINSIELTRVLLGPDWLDTARVVPWIVMHGAVVSVVGWQGRLLDIERRQRFDACLQMLGDAATVIAIACLWLTSVHEVLAVATICTIGALHGIGWLTAVYHVTGIGADNAPRVFLKLAIAAAATAACAFMARAAVGPVSGAAISFAVTGAAIAVAVFLSTRRLDREARETGLLGDARSLS